MTPSEHEDHLRTIARQLEAIRRAESYRSPAGSDLPRTPEGDARSSFRLWALLGSLLTCGLIVRAYGLGGLASTWHWGIRIVGWTVAVAVVGGSLVQLVERRKDARESARRAAEDQAMWQDMVRVEAYDHAEHAGRALTPDERAERARIHRDLAAFRASRSPVELRRWYDGKGRGVARPG